MVGECVAKSLEREKGEEFDWDLRVVRLPYTAVYLSLSENLTKDILKQYMSLLN